MTIRLMLELEADLDELVTKAILAGFYRVNPRIRWTEPEKKEAVRFYINTLVQKDQKRDC